MSLFVRVFNNFYSHRKTARLRSALGNDALWIVPRLWAYAAENQPDGDFSGYAPPELAMLIGYSGDASVMLQAMLQAGFLDEGPRIHDWAEYNDYHSTYASRAKKAADARWRKRREEKIGEENDRRQAMLKDQTSNATSIKAKEEGYHKDSRAALHILNESSGKGFREVDANLSVISQRLKEPGVDLAGVRLMIARQCRRWAGTPQEEYLRPETLFGKTKFDGYYAARFEPIAPAILNGEAAKKKKDDETWARNFIR